MARLSEGRPLAELERRIGITFTDRERFERALTHASLKAKSSGSSGYERLEFLGDRVLNLVIADRLFSRFPDADEGELSLRLNALVSANACAEVADELGLHGFIRHGGDLKQLADARTKNIRADVMESLIAAIFLERGLDGAKVFIENQWGERLDRDVRARRDPKTALQEWAHTLGTETPAYAMVERSGPDHDPIFTVRVDLKGRASGEGQGRSKRVAEQRAAAAMLVNESVWAEDEA